MSESEASACLRVLLGGEVSDEQMAELLVALAEKGETADEVVGFCRVLQESAQPLTLTQDCMDACGTGGSGLSRFNVSTAVAFVAASAGIRIAKHGNRGSRRPMAASICWMHSVAPSSLPKTQGVVRADRALLHLCSIVSPGDENRLQGEGAGRPAHDL